MLEVGSFSGEIPLIQPRLLPAGNGQVAINCRLSSGGIVPYRQPRQVRAMANSLIVMFYKKDSVWLEWSSIVDVVPAPVAANRLYVTGDGAPKIVIDTNTVLPLAVARPAGGLTAAVTGAPDPETQTTILYAYTYVTAYDEESEPSPVSNEVLRSPGMDVTLTGFVAPPAGREINRIRIYRSQTSLTGAADLYFITELALPVPASHVDDPETTAIGEPIPSTYFNPPPADLAGIIALPNGMMAAFSGKNLYFSEPWQPHAWPEKYVLTTNYDIVGLGAFGQSIAVMTKGNPYIVSGITPEQMTMDQLEVNYPCLSKRGIVDLGYAVAYPAPDGLVTISSGGAQLASRNLISREQWLRMDPATFHASQYEGRYFAAYDYTDDLGAQQRGIMVIDLSGAQPYIVRLDLDADYLFYEVGAGKLYLLKDGAALEFDPTSQPALMARWRSKRFSHAAPISYGAIFADADAIPNGGPAVIEVDVYADRTLIRTVNTAGQVHRLPGRSTHRDWEIEIRSNMHVLSAMVSRTPSELRGGAA